MALAARALLGLGFVREPHPAPRVALGAALDGLVVGIDLLLAQVREETLVRLGGNRRHLFIAKSLHEALDDVAHLWRGGPRQRRHGHAQPAAALGLQ